MFENRMLDSRKKLGWTQKQAAEAAKILPSSYSAYENNKKIPPLDIAVRIAKALDVSLEWLCGAKSPEKNQFESLGDAVRMINTLENEFRHSAIVEDDCLSLYLHNKYLSDFYRKVLKFREFAKDGDDGRELYNAWFEKALEGIDDVPIFEDDFQVVDDEDLPF